MQRKEIEQIFDRGIPEEFARDFAARAVRKTFAAGSFLALEDDECGYLPVVKSGSIRVYKSDNRREITLYHIEPGESCILSANCILNGRGFPAMAQVESDTELYLVSAADFQSWMDQHRYWRDFIYRIIDRRLSAVLTTMTEVAFSRVDARIAEWLLRRQVETGAGIKITHQELANDLGTAREVVSRLLKELEKKAILRLGRGQITILDPTALKSISGEN